MDNCLRSQIFNTNANLKKILKSFKSFIRRIDEVTVKDKLDVLVNLINENGFSYIAECITYADALNKLERADVKPVNGIYGRYCLNTN